MSNTNGMKILAIDDDSFTLAMIADMLGDLAHVDCANGGAQGLTAAAELKPDLILCDVVMPTVDGHAVCRQLRADEDTKHIPVVCVSGACAESDEIAALNAGASDFIRKPLSAALLRARVQAHLDRAAEVAHIWDLARRDGLTGIFNRRYFDERLEREWARHRRSGQPLAIGIVDLDRFKQFNDFYGHVKGDQCLVQVADLLRGCARRPDGFAARYGGEEFVYLLPGMSMDEADRFGAAVCGAIRNMAQPHESSEFHILTASIGMASVRPITGLAPSDIIRMADRALYQAKLAGRNQHMNSIATKPAN
ncbi:GGDEF domain-containing response regulator [Pseudoduganella umbonata]|uniref:diguanylate cyclase n=1 Tax=Pseudoduganella umbonata TaxID=864828 RepID=A0A4P8HLL0_9BURK|nr:diguanylate cyclase [Pseudoduganella umbonata]MBB3224884.1 diguanylate cyclase (GGDEF)-like protein [Pseudoduganella umbonata]QCP09168.1 diguanylate cyclase [Pseudoduganella umbonata]